MTTKRSIPFFEYPRLYTDDRESLLEIFDEVSKRGAFIMQKELQEFELTLAKYADVKYSIGVANATDGLELAWMAIGLRAGDEVIISSHTMLATASAIITAGGVPVPVEIGEDNLIDSQAIEAAINPRTVGIMPTQLNGRTCNMDSIMSIAEKNKLFVVEDAAQALGSRFKGKHAGTFGQASAISFFPAKLMGCLGDGGAILVNDFNLYDKMYQLHDHGRDKNGEVKSWGRNSRLDNLNAAVLNYKFNGYQEVILRRREIALKYTEQLKGLEELILPPPPVENGDHFDVYQNFELRAKERDKLRTYLQENGIGTLIQWGGKAVHQWERLGFTCRLPKVEKFFEECIMLPMNMFISDDDIDYICENVINFYRQ